MTPKQISAVQVTAQSVLRVEAAALMDAAARLDGSPFSAAVEVLLRCRGKVLVTGAGTSGIVARKIAATLTSTGTPSMFLHPNDALHGGLGAILNDDAAIAVSNSGETGEVLTILPFLKHRQVPIVAIVGRSESTLGREADVVLDAAATREACPLNLAPTASSTLAMALGDALAVCVYERKGLTPEAFALNHPSGSLGRRLTLRVPDVAPAGLSDPAVEPGAPLLEVLDAITAGGVGAAAVLEGGRRIVGLVTDGDVRRAIQRHGPDRLQTLSAREIMTADPVTVSASSLAYDALRQMEDRPSQISVLPVTDDAGLFVGIVRVHDIVRAGL